MISGKALYVLAAVLAAISILGLLLAISLGGHPFGLGAASAFGLIAAACVFLVADDIEPLQ